MVHQCKPKHVKMYMQMARALAEASPATRLKVGAVVVKENNCISTGYNAQPKHIHDSCELPDGTTDPRVRHAERSAILSLAKSTQSAIGATMFCTHACCYLCAVDIVDAGIVEFIYQHDYRSQEGLQHLRSCGIVVEQFNQKELS